MAEYARKLVAGNHPLSQRITVRYLNFDSKRTFFGIQIESARMTYEGLSYH